MGNELESIEGLTGMEALVDLNLAKNKFAGLAGAWDTFPALQSINISDNAIEVAATLRQALNDGWLNMKEKASEAPKTLEKPPEHPLNVLRQLPKLRNMDIAGNPFVSADELPETANPRVEALLCHWRLENIDGKAVTTEEMDTARLLNISMLELERARAKAEEEA